LAPSIDKKLGLGRKALHRARRPIVRGCPELDGPVARSPGKTILRDYIKATVGFEKLAEATDTPPKSLIRMFGPRGNPQARNLFSVIGYLQKRAGVQLHVGG
jgi:hypothetical protein